ncbi:MAG: transglutaminase family protein [Novosphingobium sp.]|nr:transglutaminase family protein [Novosphingobium sp.]
MRLAVKHSTSYKFSEPVGRGIQRLRLTPKETHGQRIVDWTMTLHGAREELTYEDHNWNMVTLVTLEPGVSEVKIDCSGTVETTDHAGVFGHHAGHMPLWAFGSQTVLTKPGSKMRAILSGVDVPSDDTLDWLHALSNAVCDAVAYETGHTHVDTTAEESAAHGYGVCQDHAQIFIGLARSKGIPARYVSGYLMLNDRIDQEASHAWAEAHVQGLGWVGFDVSNRISPDSRYVRVATGRDYREAAPITGVTFGMLTEHAAVQIAVEQQNLEQ